MAVNEGRIGGAHFELSVNAQKLTEGLAQAQAASARAAQAVQNEVQQINAATGLMASEHEKLAGYLRETANQQAAMAGSIGANFRPQVQAATQDTVALGESLTSLKSAIGKTTAVIGLMLAAIKSPEWIAKTGFKLFVGDIEKAEVAAKSLEETLKSLAQTNAELLGGDSGDIAKQFASIQDRFDSMRRQIESVTPETDAQRRAQAEQIEWANKLQQQAEDQLTARVRKNMRETEEERERIYFANQKKRNSDEMKAEAEKLAKGEELARDNLDDFITKIQQLEREQIASRKRVADAAMKAEMENIRRLEDYRRSLTQGFGVGDVASSDLSALVDAMKQVTANQISNRD